MTAYPRPPGDGKRSVDGRVSPAGVGWRAAGQSLLAKLISEFAYEELLAPVPAMPAMPAMPADVAASGDDPPDDGNGPAGEAGESAAGGAAGDGSDTSKDGTTGGPRRIGRSAPRHYRILTAGAVYTFAARRGTFGTWWVDAPSVRRAPAGGSTAGTAEPADDPVRFVLDAQEILGWADDVVADIVPELLATRFADARLAERAAGAGVTAAALAEAGYADLESLLGGHPCMVANKGRLGFSRADTARYTPESHAPFRLVWVAAHPDIARHVPADHVTRPPGAPVPPGSPEPPAPQESPSSPGQAGQAGQAGSPEFGLTNEALVERELDSDTRAAFTAVLTARLAHLAAAVGPPDSAGNHESSADEDSDTSDTSTNNYVWLPVHPWQWENAVGPLFTDEIETGRLVLLGTAPDRYLPLQSVRTVTNIDRPGRLDVKLSLMIRNTLVWRGLSTADTEAGPAVSAWVEQLRAGDPFLREVTRVAPVPEVAGAAVTHTAFDALPHSPYRLHELLGVLWREPVESLLAPGERARSLASLLALGSDGRALAAELVARSGLPARTWLAALLAALLPPILHYFYAYGVAFTPHGENVIVFFDGADVPRRIAVKDFGADVELVDGDVPERAGMPAAVRTHCRRWPAPVLAHSVLSAIFAGHFRYFSALTEDHLNILEEEFWRLVHDTVARYQRHFPEYAGRFAAADLLAAGFGRVCLNREHFGGAGFHDRADRDAGFDVVHGEVANPLHLAAQPGPPAERAGQDTR